MLDVYKALRNMSERKRGGREGLNPNIPPGLRPMVRDMGAGVRFPLACSLSTPGDRQRPEGSLWGWGWEACQLSSHPA